MIKTGLVTSALWSDVNDDGWIDLLVTHEWGPIKLFVNHEGHLRDATDEAGLANRLGWWNGIAGRDLDGDGDVDYVVTNLGRNTTYRVSQDRPAELFYGDFAGDGRSILMEGKYDEQGRLVPRRGKQEVEQALPQVEAAFPSFHDFAAATLADVVGGQALKDAVELTVNIVDSVVLRNDGRGHFGVEPLPIQAQTAPGFGVVLTDLDADGLCDVYLVQNLYSPRRQIGRMDGGISVLLLGQEDGSLATVSSQHAGLVVPGDAKSVVSADVNSDGWPDLVLGVNNAPAMVFEHQHVEERRMATVRLRGKPGNPTGIGARVAAAERRQNPNCRGSGRGRLRVAAVAYAVLRIGISQPRRGRRSSLAGRANHTLYSQAEGVGNLDRSAVNCAAIRCHDQQRATSQFASFCRTFRRLGSRYRQYGIDVGPNWTRARRRE